MKFVGLKVQLCGLADSRGLNTVLCCCTNEENGYIYAYRWINRTRTVLLNLWFPLRLNREIWAHL